MREFEPSADEPALPFGETTLDIEGGTPATGFTEESESDTEEPSLVVSADWEGPYATGEATEPPPDPSLPMPQSDGSIPVEPAERFEVPTGITLQVPSERTQAFDRLVTGVIELVEGLDEAAFHPEVLKAVRQLGAAAQNLTLANIADGVAEISASQMRTDSFVAIPLLPGETTITLGDSLHRPTPSRVECLATFKGVTNEAVVAADLAATPPVKQSSKDLSRYDALTHAWTSLIRLPGFEGRIYPSRGRPGMIFKPDAIPGVVVHELAHAVDNERTWPLWTGSAEEATELKVWKELRACHIGSISARGGTPNPRQDKVERLRQQYNSHEDPFAATPALLDAVARARIALIQTLPELRNPRERYLI